MQTKGTLRTCEKGHNYFKSSDCPTCPVCEVNKKPKSGFLAIVTAPARRALEANGITTLHELSNYTEEEILKFHGLGKSSIPKLRNELNTNGLSFRQD